MLDRQTGLQWVRNDNGDNINWTAAIVFCKELEEGWRLPDLNELDGLRPVSEKSRLAGSRYWSSESSGFAQAWYVYFRNGLRYSSPVEARLK